VKYHKFIVALAIALIQYSTTPVYAQKKVEYGGYFELGGNVKYNQSYAQSFYNVKLEYKFKINDKTKVEIDFRTDSEKRQLELHESSISFKFSDKIKLEAGDLKKRFGLEEQISNEKLLTINKSVINEYMEPLGFVNRDIGFQLHYNNTRDFSLLGGLHYNESHRFTVVTRFSLAGIMGVEKVGGGIQFANETHSKLPNSYITSLDLSHTIQSIKTEQEFFLGQDPLESYYSRLLSEKKYVTFFGAKTLITKKYSVSNEIPLSLEPVLILSFLSKNITQLDVNTLQVLLGFNLYFDEDIRLMVNGDLHLTNHEWDKKERTITDSNALLQLQIKW